MADARVDRYRTVQLNSRFFDRDRAASVMAALVEECRAELAAQGHHDVTITRSVEMRYLGQNYELEIPVDAEAFTDAEIAAMLETFHNQHEARFGFRLADHMEIVNFLVTGTARTGQLQFPLLAEATGPAEPVSHRPVWFGEGWIDAPVYTRESLRAGHAIQGPALVEENASVTVLDPDKTLTVDRYGNLMIAA
jgi:N-methylhydantoinase A